MYFFSSNAHSKKIQKDWDQSKISLEEDGQKITPHHKNKHHVPAGKKHVSERRSKEQHRDVNSKYKYQRKEVREDMGETEDKEDRRERKEDSGTLKGMKAPKESADRDIKLLSKGDGHEEVENEPKEDEVDKG